MLDNSNVADSGTLENLHYQNSNDIVTLENTIIEGYTSSQNANLTIQDLLDNKDYLVNSNNSDDYYYCNCCGKLTYYENITFTENDSCYCESCSDSWFYCEYCDRYYDTNYVEHYTTEDNETICEYCRDNYYYSCDNCGNLVHRDNYFYDEENERVYCESCWNNRPIQAIHDYYYKPTPIFYGSSEIGLFTGIELEIENKSYNDKTEIARNVIEMLQEVVYCKRDGSLSNGFEIVSHPFTLEYLKENKNKVQEVMKYLVDKGFRSDETSTCGLHVHISRKAFGNDKETQDKNIEKLILFFETYKNEICKISRRNGNNYAYFMSDMSPYKDKKYECLSLDYIKKYNVENHDRYKVINLNNNNTIEIRIFKGTLNFDTFMATIEFINNLVETIITTETEKITFSKVVNYKKTEYLKNYLKLREVKANYKYLHDYTKYLDILYAKENKLKDKIYANILALGKYINDLIKELLNDEYYLQHAIYKQYSTDYISSLINHFKQLINDYENNKNRDVEKIKNGIDNNIYYLTRNIETLVINNYISIEEQEKYNKKVSAILEVK